jgi:hypothetical protein
MAEDTTQTKDRDKNPDGTPREPETPETTA